MARESSESAQSISVPTRPGRNPKLRPDLGLGLVDGVARKGLVAGLGRATLRR